MNTSIIYPPEDAAGFAQWLKEKKACAGAREWSAGKDLRTVWKTCERALWLEWLLFKCGYVWEASALDEAKRIAAPAWDDYKRINDPAWDEYRRIVTSAWAKYKSIVASATTALAEYERIKAAAWDDYERIVAPAWDDYMRIRANAIRSVIPYPFGKAGQQ